MVMVNNFGMRIVDCTIAHELIKDIKAAASRFKSSDTKHNDFDITHNFLSVPAI